jgi:hypothetical protein
MKKILAVAVAVVGVAIGIRAFYQGTTVGGASFRVETGKPYADYQDLVTRRVPTDGFAMTGYQLESDSTIELRFCTHGKPEDKELIDPTIERVKYLTQNLSKEHPIHVVFVDGVPHMTVNDKPVGTGEVIREVTFPVAQ